MSSASDFGKDHGLIHEAVVTGREVGWGRDEWAKLAHNRDLMRDFRKVLLGTAAIQDLPPAKPVEEPKIEPTIVELGEFEANYDESIASKIAGNADPKRIGWSNREWATDEKFPDKRKGKKRFKASAVNFGKLMPDKDVEQWCKDNKKVRATPKEGIDIAKASPRLKLGKVVPLAMAGQFFVDANDDRYALYFDLSGDERFLSRVWLIPNEQWDGYWWFLVLEELPSEA